MGTIKLRGHSINYEGQDSFWKSVEKGEWEPYTFDVLDKMIKPDQVFIDLGTWNGVLSIYAGKIGAILIGSEPDHVARQGAILNIKSNGLRSFITGHAISDKVEEVVVSSNEFGDSTSNIIGRGSHQIVTMAMTLEDLCWSFSICLLKMDIEGAEVKVIPQSKDWLEKKRPPLYISFHPGWYANKKEDVMGMVRTLFPLYHVFGVIYDQNEYTPDDFIKAMDTPHNHSFLFLPKQ